MHAFPLHFRLLLQLSYVLYSLFKASQKVLTPRFEENGTTRKVNISLQFMALLQKIDGVAHLKIKVVCIRVRAKANFFEGYLG